MEFSEIPLLQVAREIRAAPGDEEGAEVLRLELELDGELSIPNCYYCGDKTKELRDRIDKLIKTEEKQ